MFYETITLTCSNKNGSKIGCIHRNIDESEELAQLQLSEEFILEFTSGPVNAMVVKREESHGGFGLNMDIEVIELDLD